ncbi:MAG: glycosyltransferase family 9 protein [Kiritimatiellae bacterium]|nr:glycosyltransferase family 9 protein [Kiritimatiellia bacterium]
MREIPRFLVLRGGAIGDFIMTLPALQALREHWPEAHIELVGYPHIARLALAAGLVDGLRSLDEVDMSRFFSARPEFTDAQRTFVKSFNIVLSYLHDPQDLVRENLLLAGARRVIYGSPIITEGHAADHLVKPLESLAIYIKEACPHLVLQGELVERGREWLSARGLADDAVALHPGSGSPAKNWPAANFVETARCLASEHIGSPFFILGEADGAAAAHLAANAGGVPVLTGVGLEELAGVLTNCKAYVGNDSGVTQVAAALGVRAVALFGPSNADRWGPRGAQVTILRAPGGQLDSVSVDTVMDAVRPRP